MRISQVSLSLSLSLFLVQTNSSKRSKTIESDTFIFNCKSTIPLPSFLHTLSPIPEPRRLAETNLAEAADRPNFALAVLRLVSEPSVDEQIRQAAPVNFKNHLHTRWAPTPPLEPNVPTLTPIPDSEKEQIKSLIVPLRHQTEGRHVDPCRQEPWDLGEIWQNLGFLPSPIETRNNKLEMQSVNNKALIEELDKLLERLCVPSEYATCLTGGSFDEARMLQDIEACEWLTGALRGLEVPNLDPSFANIRAVPEEGFCS